MMMAEEEQIAAKRALIGWFRDQDLDMGRSLWVMADAMMTALLLLAADNDVDPLEGFDILVAAMRRGLELWASERR